MMTEEEINEFLEKEIPEILAEMENNKMPKDELTKALEELEKDGTEGVLELDLPSNTRKADGPSR